MTNYIALLRGINVGGHTVKMDYLRSLFTQLSFHQVRSYIQTGNIFFTTDQTDVSQLQTAIEQHLQSQLGYLVPTCLRTVEQLQTICEHNPFHQRQLTPDTRFAINFLSSPVTIISTPFFTTDSAYEVISMTTTELFVIWHLQQGRPGRSYGELEKKLGISTTTRFWHTTQKIFAAAKQI